MDYINMLLIQEDPEDDNGDATFPPALSVSPSEVSSPAPPNPAQPTFTLASISATDFSIDFRVALIIQATTNSISGKVK